MVYGEVDTVILKKIELPNVLDEWKKLKSLVDWRIVRFGEINENENEMVQKFRHSKKKNKAIRLKSSLIQTC